MGTTGYYRHYDPAKRAVDYAREEMIGDGTHYEVVDHVGAKWWAIKRKSDGFTFAVHAITHTDPDMIYVKLVDESMGPIEDAPERILRKLTEPAEGTYAIEWRERAWANVRAKKALPKVKVGDVIEMAEPIAFQGGGGGFAAKTFTYQGGFRFTTGYTRVRLPKDWKTRYTWTVIEPTKETV